MPDEDDQAALLKKLYDGLVTAQMYAMSSQYIIRELMVDVARLQPDPDKYLAGLYDRSIKYVDRQTETLGDREKEVTWQTRDILGAVFRDALKAVQSSPPAGPRPDEPQQE